MSQRTSHRSLAASLAFTLAALASLGPAPARAGDAEACFTASEDGQRLRDEARLLEARARFIVCGDAACPELVRADCATWLAEVGARLPTLILSAEDAAGQDVVDVQVTLDGAPLTARLDGKAVEVDPGEHVLRFERPGSDPVELRLVAREGEKLRRVSARLGRPAEPAPRGAPRDAAAPTPATSATSGGLPLLPIALGGVAVAGGVAYAVFGLSARADADHLRSTCAPACAEADVDAVRTKILAANIAAGVSVLALGGAVAALLLRRAEPAAPAAPPATAVQVLPLPGGAAATFGATF